MDAGTGKLRRGSRRLYGVPVALRRNPSFGRCRQRHARRIRNCKAAPTGDRDGAGRSNTRCGELRRAGMAVRNRCRNPVPADRPVRRQLPASELVYLKNRVAFRERTHHSAVEHRLELLQLRLSRQRLATGFLRFQRMGIRPCPAGQGQRRVWMADSSRDYV